MKNILSKVSRAALFSTFALTCLGPLPRNQFQGQAPDGALTSMLLGIGMLALDSMRRKLGGSSEKFLPGG